MRRFTRLTNGFSKKVENLVAAVALHYALQLLPRSQDVYEGAVAAGIADHVWTLDELIGLLDAGRARPDQARPVQEASGCAQIQTEPLPPPPRWWVSLKSGAAP